jgi:hypothetical protein
MKRKIATKTKTKTKLHGGKGKSSMMMYTPLAKRGKNAGPRRGEYTYENLDELLKTLQTRIYVYGVVLDCSAPYYNDDLSKYVCTVKLIDASLNPEMKGKGGQKFVQATIFARLEKEIPQPTKVGSILRIHRGETKHHENKMQLNCDINIKAAWVLFDPTESDAPLEHTGHVFTFTPKDSMRLAKIRDFARKFFHNYEDLGGITLAEAERKKAKEFDFACVVLEVKQKGTDHHIRICDSDRSAKLIVKDSRYSHVSPLDVVHVRSAQFAEARPGKCLTLNTYSNILQLPKEYAGAKLLLKRVNESTNPEVRSQLAIYKAQPKDRVICSKLVGGFKGAAVPLKALLSGDALKKGQNEYRVHVTLIQISPKHPSEWLRVFDPSTQKLSSVADVLADKKGVLPKGLQYCWNMQLFVKDETAREDTNLYTILLNTAEGKGQEFFSLDLGRKAPTDSTYAELKRIYKMLTRSWADLDLILECTEVSGQLILRVVKTALTI